LLTGRALLLLLAGASTFSILFGSVDVLAATSDAPAHSARGGPPARAHEPHDQDHRCHHARSRDPCDDGHDHDRPRAPTPSSTPPSTQRTALPERVSTPASRSAPAPAALAAAQGNPVPPRTPPSSSAPKRVESPAGPRPPVLAPPSLTVPAARPMIATGSGAGAGYVIALSTVLVAATIAVLSLVLVRRSG